MKKIFYVLLIVFFAAAFIACDGSDGRTVIRYANWNLGTPESLDTNMERLMIKAFEEKYPHIKVEIIERPKIPGTNDDVSWTDFLTSRASIESLPDVFMADNIPYYVVQDWVYNLTEIAGADPEFMNISADIRNVITYGGKIMAVPCAVFYAGYIVNKTLYENRYQESPTVDTTFAELMQLTKAAANHASTNNTGVVGLDGIEHILHWYPAQLNEEFGWFTLPTKASTLIPRNSDDDRSLSGSSDRFDVRLRCPEMGSRTGRFDNRSASFSEGDPSTMETSCANGFIPGTLAGSRHGSMTASTPGKWISSAPRSSTEISGSRSSQTSSWWRRTPSIPRKRTCWRNGWASEKTAISDASS